MIGSKANGLFLDFSGSSIMAAVTSGTKAPFVVEEWRELPMGEPVETAEAIRGLAGVRGSGYVPARCAVYPAGRIVNKIPVEGRKLKDDGYLPSHIQETLKLDVASYQLCSLSPVDGSDSVQTRTSAKEVLICGAPAGEIAGIQQGLLGMGVYPEALELGTVAAVGGVVDYLGFTDQKAPALLLEVGAEMTYVFVLSRDGIEISRTVAFGINSMIPVVQKELGLKDEESARKLFFSNSFDFTGMGPQLTKRLLRELQASIGFYEVQTGQSIASLCCTLLPAKVEWLESSLADVLGMKALRFEAKDWLGASGVTFADPAALAALGPAWNGLMCLMGEYKGPRNEAVA